MIGPPTALVLGAGFLGSEIARALRADGVAVHCACRRGQDRDLSLDLLDPNSIEGALRKIEPDLVIQAAGQSSVSAAWADPGGSFAVNTGGTLNLLEALAAHRPEAHLTVISSAAVYGPGKVGSGKVGPVKVGPGEDGRLDEPTPLLPDSPYGAGKAAMEVLCDQYSRSRMLTICKARPFNLIGPGQPAGRAASDFAGAIAAAESGGADRAVIEVGNPLAARDFVDVRDAAEGIALLARRRSEGAFNICSGELVEITHLIRILTGLTELKVSTRAATELARRADPKRLVGVPDKIAERLGWRPRIRLERSLSDLLESVRKRGAAATARPPQPQEPGRRY